MAYNESGFGGAHQQTVPQSMLLQIQGEHLDLPDDINLKNAHYTRRGMDLLIKDAGHDIVVDSYFAFDPAPALEAGDAVLSPKMVSSFVKASPDYAANNVASDESPVGIVDEVTGGATVTRLDGTTETVRLGVEIYQGDIVETAGNGAVNIVFIDDTSFAVSEDARLAIDEYVYDPVTEAGQTDFSVLKGVFVYTSGAIGRDDPDDVTIDTPVGSIGIRGTIIAGDVDQGEITVVEGAIVLRDFSGNEVTLANQFETAKFEAGGRGISHMGDMAAGDVVQKFASISNVAPDLFSSMNDAANENSADQDAGDDGASGDGQDDARGEEASAEGADDTQASDSQSEDAAGKETGKSDGEPQEAKDGPEADSQQNSEQEARDGDTKQADQGEPEAVQDGAESQGERTGDGEAGTDSAAKGQQNGPDSANQSTDGGASSDTQSSSTSEPVKMANPNQMGGTRKAAPSQESQEGTRSTSAGNDSAATQPNASDSSGTTTSSASATTDNVNPVVYEEDNNNRAPELVKNNLPPSEFFQVSENTGTLEFFFDQVFRDLDGDTIVYRLSSQSEAVLESVLEDASTGAGVLDSAVGSARGWEFDQENGHLTLQINESFAEYIQSLELTVVASDGVTSSSYTFEVKAFDDGATFTEGGRSYTVSNISSGTVSGQDEIIFVDDGANVFVELADADNSEVHLGEGGQTVQINADSNGNLIIGGNAPASDDFFYIKDVDNTVWGMDGADTFKINLDYVHGDTDGSGNEIALIDGGWNNLSTAQQVIQDVKSGTIGSYNSIETGDVLELYNADGGDVAAGVVNFGAIDLLVKNVETLLLEGADTVNSGRGVIVNLGLEDVLSMTDSKNVLMIQGDSNDVVNLTGFERLDVNGDTDIDTSDTLNLDGVGYDVYVGTNANGAEVTLVVNSSVDTSIVAV